jgi:hypothetical protein
MDYKRHRQFHDTALTQPALSLLPPMPFFSNATGVNILGGNFYSAAGDVSIQNDVQLPVVIQYNYSEALVCGGPPVVPCQDGSQTAIADGPFTESDPRRRYSGGIARLLRYGVYQPGFIRIPSLQGGYRVFKPPNVATRN